MRKFWKKEYLLLFLLLVVFFLYRWNSFLMPFERDEGEYAYSAWLLRQGISPYENSYLQKPPLVIFVYVIGQTINEDALWVPRILGAGFELGAIFLVGLLALADFGRPARWVAMFIAAIMFSMPFLTPQAANTEKFMLLPLVGLVYLARRRSGSIHKVSFWGGVLGACAFLFKPICITVVVFIFCTWLWKYKGNFGKAVSLFIAFGLGFLLVVLLGFSYFWANGSFGYLVEEVFVFNKYYLGSFLSDWAQYSGVLVTLGTILLLLLIAFAVSLSGSISKTRTLLFYLAISAVSLPMLLGARSGHYYFLVVPFLVLLLTDTILALCSFAAKYLEIKTNILLPLITVVSLVFIGGHLFYQLPMSPVELSRWMYSDFNPFVEAPSVAREVKENTKVGDYVYIAGSEPEILFYAKRRSPTRFVISYPISIRGPLRKSYEVEILSDLYNKKPKIIVFTNSWLSWVADDAISEDFLSSLRTFISDNYYPLDSNFSFEVLEIEKYTEGKKAGLFVFKRRI